MSTALAVTPSVEASFYAADPAGGAEALNTVTIPYGLGASGIDDIEDAKYVTLRAGGDTVTLRIFQGETSKYSIKVDQHNTTVEDADTLAEVLDGLL